MFYRFEIVKDGLETYAKEKCQQFGIYKTSNICFLMFQNICTAIYGKKMFILNPQWFHAPIVVRALI